MKIAPRRQQKNSAQKASKSQAIVLIGDELEDYVKNISTSLYRYKPNVIGFMVLLVIALISLGVGGYIWFFGAPEKGMDLLPSSLMFGLSLSLLGSVFYWLYYTRMCYLATSEKHLIVGRGSQAKAYLWSGIVAGLSAQESGLEEKSQFKGVLKLEYEGEPMTIRLYNRYICLSSINGFISKMLTEVSVAPKEEAGVSSQEEKAS